MKFSVIIPTWNEGQQIHQVLKRLRGISDREQTEIILVDGGSKDNTVESARKWVDRVEIMPSPNRGAQLHAGAQLATGDLLFFLHADTQPPGNWQESLEQFWLTARSNFAAATVFRVDYGARWTYRLVAWTRNWRASWRQLAYGDAGVCTTREIYQACGGFPQIPLMEDVVFSQRLRRQGRIVVLPERIRPAASRLYRHGPIFNSLRNCVIRACFAVGISPGRLWRYYYAPDVHNRKEKSPNTERSKPQ